jgi:hypothetical protein
MMGERRRWKTTSATTASTASAIAASKYLIRELAGKAPTSLSHSVIDSPFLF